MAARTVDAYVAALPPEQRLVMQVLRDLVLAAAPDAKESIKWAQPVYEDHGAVRVHQGVKRSQLAAVVRQAVKLNREKGDPSRVR